MKLENLLEAVDSLPPTPRILPKLQALLRRDDTDLSDLQNLIKVDAGLSAQIIRTANSIFYGAGGHVDSLEEALVRLGFRGTYRVASYFCSKEVLHEALPLYGLKQAEFLEHSVVAALLIVEFGRRLKRADVETLYTIALLHGIGRVVINRYFLRKGIHLYETAPDGVEVEISEAEIHRIVGFSNAQVGAALLEQWQFPQPIVAPIRHQEDCPASLQALDCAESVQLLQISKARAPLIIAAANHGQLPDPPDDLPDMAGLGMGADELRLCLLRALAEFSTARKLLH